MFRWKIIFSLLVVFFAGMLLGVVGTVGKIKKEFAARTDSSTWAPRTMAWLDDAAHLTPTQADAIRPDVEAAVKKLIDLRSEAEAGRKTILAELFVEILPKVDPPQREALKEAVKKAGDKPTWTQGAE